MNINSPSFAGSVQYEGKGQLREARGRDVKSLTIPNQGNYYLREAKGSVCELLTFPDADQGLEPSSAGSWSTNRLYRRGVSGVVDARRSICLKQSDNVVYRGTGPG